MSCVTKQLFLIAMLSLPPALPAKAADTCRPVDLRCEYLVNPLGLDVRQPRLYWQMADARRGARQTAYRILVAGTPERLREGAADIWDSGKTLSGQSAHIVYAGPVLKAGQRCWWTVRLWDKNEHATAYAAPAYWEMGLLDTSEWTADWIGLPAPEETPKAAVGGPATLLRKTFSIVGALRRARVYVTALGSYRLHVNGQRIGHDLLTPDWTDYRQHVTFQTYDVTDRLQKGENALGVMLGDGWYASGLGWNLERNAFGPPPDRLRLQLVLDYTDGHSETVASDGSWRATPGPILRSEIYAGEVYDARKEQPGWDRVGFDDRTWQSAQRIETKPVQISAQHSPTIQITETIKPRVVTSPAPGVYIFDMGQNMVGWARLKVKGPVGTTVRLRFAEILQPDGTVYRANLRRADATDTYILKGGGEEVFEPHFTYHGFRYIEVTGYPGTPAQDAVTGCVFHTAADKTGQFACSNEMVNQLYRNIEWGQRGNMQSVPTDCPQRDERLGWMGDAEIFWDTACYNRDMAAFTAKWMRDVVEAQSPAGGFSDVSPRVIDGADGAPAWGDAGIIVPWTGYRHYGDTRLLEECWPAMTKWMDYIHSVNPNLIWEKRRNNDFGDWVPAGSDTPKDVIATAYWAYDARLMAEMAHALGKEAESQTYHDLYEGIKAAFIQRFVKPDGVVGNGSQTSQVLALYFGLLPDDLRASASKLLLDDINKRGGHLSTGFIGTAYLMPALIGSGVGTETAYHLLLNDTYPSWGYMIKKGATTIWERWNGDTGDPGMNSFNHYAFGAVGGWLYRYAGGISAAPDGAGFQRIVIHPYPGTGLENARAEYDSLYGKIVSEWSHHTGEPFALSVTIPANTTATIYVPAPSAQRVLESGKPIQSGGITLLREEDGCAVFAVDAGSYRFTVR